MTRPHYWTSQEGEHDSVRLESRYMRRKLEHLLRSCTAHEDGCQSQESLCQARVIKVERIENDSLWRRYASRRDACRPRRRQWAANPERSRPIRCELRDDERMLFHGTTAESIDDIASGGMDIRRASQSDRYGVGAYFSDESCKAHQYASVEEQEDGGRIFSMLYCRVAPGKTLRMRATGRTATQGYLTGMRRPDPSDPIFASNIRGRGRVREAWDSIDVTGATRSMERQVRAPSPSLSPKHPSRHAAWSSTSPRHLHRSTGSSLSSTLAKSMRSTSSTIVWTPQRRRRSGACGSRWRSSNGSS